MIDSVFVKERKDSLQTKHDGCPTFALAFPDFCYATQDRTACAAFIKESRMKFDNATSLDRNPGYVGERRRGVAPIRVLSRFP